VASVTGGTWTQAVQGASNLQASVYWRAAAGTEPAAITITDTLNGFSCSLQWMRWTGQASSPADIAVLGSFTGPGASSTATSGAMANANDLLLAFAGMTKNASAAPSAPVWTAGLTDTGTGPAAQFGGGDSTQLSSWAGYLENAGTGSLSPQVSWTGLQSQAVMAVVSFLPVVPTGAPAQNAPGSGAVPGAAGSLRIGMTIRGS
jgi:hypothetical protein